MRTKALRDLTILTAASLLAACGGADDDAARHDAAAGDHTAACADAAEGAVTVVDPWVRSVADASAPSAAFMTICNGRDAAAKLVSVSASIAARTELHETERSADGVVKMSPIPSVDVPAAGAAALAPGGRHIMLFALEGPIAAGDEVGLKLTFEDGSSTNATAVARAPGEAAHGGH